MTGQWKPKEFESFYHLMIGSVEGSLKVTRNIWHNYPWQRVYYKENHVFCTRKEAERKRKQILKVLKER